MNKRVVRGLEFYTMSDGGYFGDPGESPEAYSSDSFAGGTTNLVDTSRPSGGDSGGSSAPPATVVVDGVTYSTATTPGTGSDDEDEDQMVQQIIATPEEDRNWVEQQIAEMYEDEDERDKLGTVFYDPQRADFTGYMSEAPFTGGLGGLLAAIFGGKQGLVDGKRPRSMVYTGFGKNPFAPPDTSDNEERRRDTAAAAPVVTPQLPTSDDPTATADSYYATGAGSRTVNLSMPENVAPYLQGLYAQTQSPIGTDYEALLRKLLKERKRMSGLDIFKPVSIVS